MSSLKKAVLKNSNVFVELTSRGFARINGRTECSISKVLRLILIG